MTKAVRPEQSRFGFVTILIIAVAVSMTAAALTILWIASWVYLREHNKGVVEGNLTPKAPTARVITRL